MSDSGRIGGKCPRCGEIIRKDYDGGPRDSGCELYCTEDCCDQAVYEAQERARDEAEVIRQTERREALLERRSYALDRLANCSGEAEAMWLEMIEECEEELAKLDKPE
jgi:hypothetical protein